MHSGKRRFLCALGALTILCAWMQPAKAECRFEDPNADPVILFTLPAQLLVESDAEVGTILYSAETTGNSNALGCSGSVKANEGYTVLTDADNSGVFPGVYKTSVPGIGFRAARNENAAASFTGENIISPMHYLGMVTNWNYYASVYHIAVELVVIGPVQSGVLDTSRFNADYLMGSLAAVQLRFAPSNVNVIVNTCNLLSKNINVPLNTITTGSFSGAYSDILSGSDFKIEVANCGAGTRVDYKFSSTGSTGVTDGNILNITQGDDAASGVGIQVLDKENNVLNFDREYTGIESAGGQGTETIPLKARYVKTGTVKGGVVNAVATFEVYYR